MSSVLQQKKELKNTSHEFEFQRNKTTLSTGPPNRNARHSNRAASGTATLVWMVYHGGKKIRRIKKLP